MDGTTEWRYTEAMARAPASLLILALLPLAFSGCIFSGGPDIGKMENDIEGELALRLAASTTPIGGTPVPPSVEVECPDQDELKQGQSFKCKASVMYTSTGTSTLGSIDIPEEEKGTVTIKVLQDDKFEWEYEPRS